MTLFCSPEVVHTEIAIWPIETCQARSCADGSSIAFAPARVAPTQDAGRTPARVSAQGVKVWAVRGRSWSEGPVVVLVVERGTVGGDGQDERLGTADEGGRCVTRRGRDEVAAAGPRVQFGPGGHQGDQDQVDDVLEGSQDRELGRVPQLAAGGQPSAWAATREGLAACGHPCGSRSDGPSMRTVWHW